MAKLFKKSAEYLRKSVWIVPITLVFIVMFVVSLGLFVEDYSTSLYGYIEIPTRKANIWIPYLVALVPQLAQIGFGFIFIENTEKRWALLVVFACHIVDVFSDVYYKAVGQSLAVWIIAFFESEIIYTLGSEIMLTASLGMLIELFPDFLKQLSASFANIISGVIAGAAILGLKLNKTRDINMEYSNEYVSKKNFGNKPRYIEEDD